MQCVRRVQINIVVATPLRFGWLPVPLVRLATAGSSMVSSQDPAQGKNLPCQLWINIYTADSMYQYIWIDIV